MKFESKRGFLLNVKDKSQDDPFSFEGNQKDNIIETLGKKTVEVILQEKEKFLKQYKPGTLIQNTLNAESFNDIQNLDIEFKGKNIKLLTKSSGYTFDLDHVHVDHYHKYNMGKLDEWNITAMVISEPIIILNIIPAKNDFWFEHFDESFSFHIRLNLLELTDKKDCMLTTVIETKKYYATKQLESSFLKHFSKVIKRIELK